MDTFGERLKLARSAKGLTQTVVAAALKIDRVSVSNWETDTTKPAMEKMSAIADLYGVSLGWLMTGNGNGPGAPSQARTGQVLIPGSQLVGDRDFKIYAGAQGGNGQIIVSHDPIEIRRRPSILEGVTAGYGLLVFGESMWPAYRHGDLALVHPGLPYERSQVHIFYDNPPFGAGGDTEAIIKNLLGWTDTKWHLQQFNPDEKFDVDRVDWPTAHQVVGKYGFRR